MATAKNGLIMYESGRSLVDFEATTDSGDHKVYNPSGLLMSNREGYEYEIRPNGVVSGSNMVSPGAADDEIDVASFSGYIAGDLLSFAAETLTVTRGSTDGYIINSVVAYDNAGSAALKIVAGTESTSFTEERDVAGGPPLIGADEVEIAQVRLTSLTAGAVTESQIYQVPGQHQERYDFPVFDVNPIGMGSNADDPNKVNAYIEFSDALPTIHTGSATKKVYAKYYIPTFAEFKRALEWTPIEMSHSVSSSEYYSGAISSVSSSLGQGGFTVYLDDGITDPIIGEKNNTLTFKFFPSKTKSAYQVSQGIVGLARTFPVGDQIQASVTVSGENETAEFSG